MKEIRGVPSNTKRLIAVVMLLGFVFVIIAAIKIFSALSSDAAHSHSWLSWAPCMIYAGIGLTLILGGGLVLTIARYKRLRATGVAAQALISRIEQRMETSPPLGRGVEGMQQHGRDMTYYVYVVYKDNKGLEYEKLIDFYHSKLEVGDALPIRYNPDEPDDVIVTAAMGEISNIAMLSVLLLIFGLGLILFGELIIRGIIQL